MSMKPFLLVLSFLLVRVTAGANDHAALFRQATDAYQQKQYDKAFETWEKIATSGVESSELYFNLGNASYKMNRLADAIWYYEKAFRLDPGDQDIQFNLRMANARIVDKIDVLPELFYQKWWKAARALHSPDGWAWLSILFISLFFLFTACYLLFKILIIRKISFWIALIFLLTTFFSLTFAWQTYQIHRTTTDAIVFTPTVNVKSSPDDHSVDLFVVHEGTKVGVTDQLGEWYRIQIANGSVGWIRANTVKVI